MIKNGFFLVMNTDGKCVEYKIRKHFLDLIRAGVKRHEYRLGKKDVCVGDCLELICNDDPTDRISVLVVGIERFGCWEEALKEHWEEDFKGMYESLDDLVRECSTFYSKEEIEKYGINVFEISLVHNCE